MEDGLFVYIKAILCYVLFASLITQLFPREKDKKYLELTIGLVFLYLVMKPALATLKRYDEIMNASYFQMDFDSGFLKEQQEDFMTQTGVYILNSMEEQMEAMGYENPSLTMKRSGTSWKLQVEINKNLSDDWEEEKKNLKKYISNVYNLNEDNINIEIRG